jgi:hypothetical protein
MDRARPSVRQIEYFVAISETLNFRAAANDDEPDRGPRGCSR